MTRSGRQETVLVADDSLTVRALLRSQLRERGYTVVEAADGLQALERARETVPDVVLLDVEMPGMDGFAVLEHLKRDPELAEVPVVFITGRTSAQDAVRGLELGAHDYLRKPFEPAELAARVHAAVRTRRLRDELRALNHELAHEVATDSLTRTASRRFSHQELSRACSRSLRHSRPLALLLVDVDLFRGVNEAHGHQAGDEALVEVAERLESRLRTEDVLGRWGGGEFVVIAPETGAEGAAALAEALRAQVAARPVSTSAGALALTASVGWALWRGEGPEELVSRAEAAARAAKEAGRDRVAGDPGTASGDAG